MAGKLAVGVNEKLYNNTGTFGTPVWTLIDFAMDVTLPLTKSKAEIKSRLSTFRTTKPAIKSVGLEFGILGDTADSNWVTLRDAFINDTNLDFAIADGAIATSGTQYYRGNFYIYDFPVDQKLEEAQNVKVTADLAYEQGGTGGAAPTGWVSVP